MTWADDATRGCLALAATGKQWTVDEVYEWMSSRSIEPPPEDAKTLGAVVTNLSRGGYIEPHYSWFNSVRKKDRPIRVWVGAGSPSEWPQTPSEDDIVAALVAIETVGRKRSEIMHEQIRRARQTSGVVQAV